MHNMHIGAAVFQSHLRILSIQLTSQEIRGKCDIIKSFGNSLENELFRKMFGNMSSSMYQMKPANIWHRFLGLNADKEDLVMLPHNAMTKHMTV